MLMLWYFMTPSIAVANFSASSLEISNSGFFSASAASLWTP
jgi:hypothetical protein